MTYIIAAAGTGGHVNPALAVAAELESLGVGRDQILFLGGDRFASTAVPDAGYPFAGFELTHLRRSLSPQNLRIPFILRSTSRAMADTIRSVEGAVVLGMSGYVTVPAAMAARRAKVPFVLQEQNAVPGIAARFASRRAGRTFLGLAGPSSHLPRSELIGNPIRSEFNDFDRESRRPAARQRYGVDLPGPVVGVMGGSQGARVLNQVVEPLLASGAVGAVVHLTGKDLYPEVHDRAKESSLPWVCVAYEAEMEHFYAAVDLVVSRSGAMTVTELAATSTPSVLVPLARVGQQGNAEVLRAAGGAEVIEQSVIEGLASRVADLVADRDRLDAMGRGASSVHRPGAARLIAHHLMEVAHG